MTKNYLIQQLANIENAKRENRNKVRDLVIENEVLFPFLVEIVFENQHKTAVKAAWILELVCEQKLDLIIPQLDFFISNIIYLKNESAIRPASKICLFLAEAYTSKSANAIQNKLTQAQIDQIIEIGFDWLISNRKVATKAYTMSTLYLFGKNHHWVHQELKLIIQQNMLSESAAYKARGKMTLRLINKK